MKTKYVSKAGIVVAIAVFSCAGLAAIAQDCRILHHFSGSPTNGAYPFGSLISSGSALYGMTKDGGVANLGCVFRINPDGSGFEMLHSFSGGATNGSNPLGSLFECDGVFYGMTQFGGASNLGTVFRINPDGTGFNLLHSFSGAANDGSRPWGNLIGSGSTLYGMSRGGGSTGNGVVFKIETNGAFAVIHSFTGTGGRTPQGSLVQSGSTFYGMTSYGGSANRGVIFRLDISNTNYTVLRNFTGGSADGADPFFTTLMLREGFLYGMTSAGGGTGNGIVFKMNTNSSGFGILHSFAGGSGDGAQPYDSLFMAGSTFYGITHVGGKANRGTLFQMNLDGSGYNLLHHFEPATGGEEPWNSPIVCGAMLYGMARVGGNQNQGTVFALDLAPRLAISPSSTNVNIFWSTNYQGFTLESTDQLTGSWAPVPGVTGYSATLPVNPGTNRFFRLKK